MAPLAPRWPNAGTYETVVAFGDEMLTIRRRSRLIWRGRSARMLPCCDGGALDFVLVDETGASQVQEVCQTHRLCAVVSLAEFLTEYADCETVTCETQFYMAND